MKKKGRKFEVFLWSILVLVVLVVFTFLNTKQFSDQSSLNSSIAESLNNALQDEYHAEAIYQQVIEDFGDVTPYTNIVRAEKQHSQAIEGLYIKYGLEFPENEWLDNSKIPSFDSIQGACQASAQAEVENIALYDLLLPNIKEKDIKEIFEKLRDASKDKHLPAFNRCS